MGSVAREEAFGQAGNLTPVDRFGVWLSSVAVRRRASFVGKRLADFGCGYDAQLARGLLDQVDSALLVDVKLADDLKCHPRITAVEGAIEQVLPGVADASVDIVMCISVLEHLAEPQPALDGFRRVLAPGGRLLLNVPSWRGKLFLEFSAFHLGLSPAAEMDEHKRYFDPRDLWPMLVRAGFMPSAIRCRRHKAGLNTFAVCRVPRETSERPPVN